MRKRVKGSVIDSFVLLMWSVIIVLLALNVAFAVDYYIIQGHL